MSSYVYKKKFSEGKKNWKKQRKGRNKRKKRKLKVEKEEVEDIKHFKEKKGKINSWIMGGWLREAAKKFLH